MMETGWTHRFIPAARPEAPVTLLLLHGTGGNENDLLPLGQSLLPGAALLSPRGRVLENGMPRFFRRLAEGVFDLPDLHRRTQELADFLTAARSEYGLTGGLVAVGYSNGANIAASLLLQHPGVLSAAVLFRAMVPFVPPEPPRIPGTPVLLAAGRRDGIAPPAETARLQQLLEQAGATVQVSWHEGGHELGQDDMAAAQTWLQRRLVGA